MDTLNILIRMLAITIFEVTVHTQLKIRGTYCASLPILLHVP